MWWERQAYRVLACAMWWERQAHQVLACAKGLQGYTSMTHVCQTECLYGNHVVNETSKALTSTSGPQHTCGKGNMHDMSVMLASSTLPFAAPSEAERLYCGKVLKSGHCRKHSCL